MYIYIYYTVRTEAILEKTVILPHFHIALWIDLGFEKLVMVVPTFQILEGLTRLSDKRVNKVMLRKTQTWTLKVSGCI